MDIIGICLTLSNREPVFCGIFAQCIVSVKRERMILTCRRPYDYPDEGLIGQGENTHLQMTR